MRDKGGTDMATEALSVLRPADWVNQVFPLTGDIVPNAMLPKGEWIIFMYRVDCPKCEAALPLYEKLAVSGRKSVLLLEVPPYAEGPVHHKSAHHARLTGDREWYVQTPVEIRIHDGTVTLASTELPSLNGL
jgi:hypothetical protein